MAVPGIMRGSIALYVRIKDTPYNDEKYLKGMLLWHLRRNSVISQSHIIKQTYAATIKFSTTINLCSFKISAKTIFSCGTWI